MRTKLTPTFIDRAKPPPGKDRAVFWDTAMPGFGLMTTANGARSYVVQYRAGGISRRLTLKGGLSLSEARREARITLGAVAKGGDPLQEARGARAVERNSLKSVATEYFEREGKALGARTLRGKQDSFRLHIDKPLGSRPIDDIKRSEIVRMLDRTEDASGPTAAQHALSALRRVMSWHAGRSDDFKSPIVAGMSRIKPAERARQRVLTDDEVRTLWKVASRPDAGAFDHLVKFLLLTATRLREASSMTRDEVNGDEWLIPARRFKGKRDHLIPLSSAAQQVLAEIPVIGDRGWMFTSTGTVAISGFSKFKQRFDAKVLAELRERDPEAVMEHWTLHDLRRSARSLMSRAGVDADIAERCLGHVIGGVRGVYDRHTFKNEKRRAFELLAAEVARIRDPQPPSVVPLRRPKK